jgi:hypothetical protein
MNEDFFCPMHGKNGKQRPCGGINCTCPDKTYAFQWAILYKAKKLGWKNSIPDMLGSSEADKAVNEAKLPCTLPSERKGET